jgi:hypothetical protein
MNRNELLDAAKETVADRGEQYGSIWDNHERIAVIWTALVGIEFQPEHVAMMDDDGRGQIGAAVGDAGSSG